MEVTAAGISGNIWGLAIGKRWFQGVEGHGMG